MSTNQKVTLAFAIQFVAFIYAMVFCTVLLSLGLEERWEFWALIPLHPLMVISLWYSGDIIWRFLK